MVPCGLVIRNGGEYQAADGFFSNRAWPGSLVSSKWREILALTLGSLFSFSLVQGGIDLVVWGIPFAEIRAYINVCFTVT